MRIKELVGYNPTSRTYNEPETVLMTYKAGAALTVGTVVAQDVTDSSGIAVIAATTTAAVRLRCVGLYEGDGGTGATTTATGFTGKAAVTGDIVAIKVYGIGTAVCGPQTTNDLSTAGISLTPGNTAGQLQAMTAATVTGWLMWPLVSAEVGPTTAVSTGATKVFLRFM